MTISPEKIQELENRIKVLEEDRARWKNLQVAQESGGGSVQFGDTWVMLKINSLTPGGSQTP